MIRRVLIVDTETTGLHPKTDNIIEIGAILYSVEHRSTMAQFSSVLHAEANPCESINRISAAALSDLPTIGELSPVAGALIEKLIGLADVFVAHNAPFDRAFLVETYGDLYAEKPFLCTMDDFAWPLGKPGSSLVSLALDHGIGVSSAHRALTDCQLIASLFDRMHLFGCDLQEMFTRAMRPSAMFCARVSFDQRGLVKDAGFKWDPTIKQFMKKCAIADVDALPFRCVRV